jgi:hypothetical protein
MFMRLFSLLSFSGVSHKAYRKLHPAIFDQMDIVTFRSPCQRSLSFIFLNVADFKGIRRGQNLRMAQADFAT